MPSTRTRFPHPLALLVGCIALAAVLTHLLPAGEYERRENAATGRMAVVPGTYHAVAPSPVGLWGTVLSVQLGIVAAASVVAFVFLVGGAFSVVEETGALGRAVDWLTRVLRDRGSLVIPASSLFFAAGGIVLPVATRFASGPLGADAVGVGAEGLCIRRTTRQGQPARSV